MNLLYQVHPIDNYAAIAELYDSVPFYATRPDVAFYVEHAIGSGGPVLELGCGTGRVLIPIAREGLTVTGIDSSLAMLGTCASKLALEADSTRACTTLLLGDMRNFHLQRRFALVVIPFGSFQRLLTMQDQLDCLTAIRSHLHPEGQLVFDLINLPPQMLNGDDLGETSDSEQPFLTSDGRTIVRRYRIVSHDSSTQVTQRELIYYVTHPDGRDERIVHAFGFRRTLRSEIEHLLAKSEFEADKLYADFDKTSYGSTYGRELVVVARPRRLN